MIPVEIKECNNCKHNRCDAIKFTLCMNEENNQLYKDWEPNYQLLKERLEHIIKSAEWCMNNWKPDETYYLKCSIVDIWKIARGENRKHE